MSIYFVFQENKHQEKITFEFLIQFMRMLQFSSLLIIEHTVL